jgi:hypothetical protein
MSSFWRGVILKVVVAIIEAIAGRKKGGPGSASMAF